MRVMTICVLLFSLLLIRPEFARNETTLFSNKVAMIEKACLTYDVDVELAIAIIMTESSFRHKVVKWENRAKENAYGLGQVLLSTAKLYDKKITARKLLIPERNIDITVRHIAMLSAKHNGNIKKITMEYNGGPRAKKNIKYYHRVIQYYDALTEACGQRG